jgi:PII-like signaling protein
VNQDCLKLTTYFGERDRAADGFLADALSDIYARHQLQTSLLIRGTEGFGIKHHLHTDRLLTLSEDLPLMSVAVDTRERIERALAEVVQGLAFEGLVTLERARLLTGVVSTGSADLPGAATEAIKLTVYVGRHQQAGGRPAYEAVVDLLWRHGLAGATVLLGVDGTAHGVRQRARFFAANARVPVMIIAAGERDQVVEALPALGEQLERPLVTLERVRVCKRDGRRLAEPPALPDADPSGHGIWQKLIVHSGEQARTADDQPLHHQLILALREAGAAGATSLRGIWGFQGTQAPRGDSFWQLRRHVPVLTVIVDTPQQIRRWYELVDQLTVTAGLVTSEIVPAFRATGPGVVRGGLKLAQLG